AVVGMRVLASKETPGLGDKIEKDPNFIANFSALDVSLGTDGQDLAQSIEAVKHGAKTAPYQIDGITGATISSVAIAAILRQSSAQWVPLIYRQQAELVNAGGADGGQ
nr:FMN-binding protein [Halioglobus sp.]